MTLLLHLNEKVNLNWGHGIRHCLNTGMTRGYLLFFLGNDGYLNFSLMDTED